MYLGIYLLHLYGLNIEQPIESNLIIYFRALWLIIAFYWFNLIN